MKIPNGIFVGIRRRAQVGIVRLQEFPRRQVQRCVGQDEAQPHEPRLVALFPDPVDGRVRAIDRTVVGCPDDLAVEVLSPGKERVFTVHDHGIEIDAGPPRVFQPTVVGVGHVPLADRRRAIGAAGAGIQRVGKHEFVTTQPAADRTLHAAPHSLRLIGRAGRLRQRRRQGTRSAAVGVGCNRTTDPGPKPVAPCHDRCASGRANGL